MPNKFDPKSPWATVIDAEGNHIILVEVCPDWQGNIVPVYHEMQDGESLIFADWQGANDLATKWTQPKWDGKKWIAGGEEIIPEPPEELPEPPPSGFPPSKYTPEEMVGTLEALMDILSGGESNE